MPELPEVETTRRGITPHILGHQIHNIEIRERRMRWPVEDDVLKLVGKTINSIERRAKYLLIGCDTGTLMLHLGMSGSLRICPHEIELRKHDHFIMRIDGGMELRLHDPRRFGAVLWHDKNEGPLDQHPLLHHLGPEPLEDDFHSDYLTTSCKGRKISIKQLVMNNKIVVGAGNIYACEALFRSGIRPTRPAGKISKTRLVKLTQEIKDVLAEAIEQGGTTLRDFLREDGKPGYFKQKLHVYDRENEPCHLCDAIIKRIVISNRSTFYCPRCQR
ncbi:MAG: bifunctional DNA-formamidopyrimidine glycosylase/DNA-(apurinic or apyrimidinic site) lyase [Akkermansiaceae bacterium]|jgi:formamidopyrimidine-DNA glycosylase|tara:strand:- start:11444 stop:12265 length:822 start_codon:yes stop_codon:yes gene_type:complete